MIIGIDIGGTSIKLGLVSSKGKISYKTSYLVNLRLSQEGMLVELADFIKEWISEYKITGIKGIGIGCPGVINSSKGSCDYSANLNWVNLKICETLEKLLGYPCKITNDANAAALGEARFGSGQGYENMVMLTLGTGVGGGIVINHKLFEGQEGKGAELGHMIIDMDGRRCSCGLKGCLEAYASATALIKDTKRAMKQNLKSKMWEMVNYDINKVNGITCFEACKMGDKTAEKVVNQYVKFLSQGLISICNVFRPSAIILGGGLSNQKKYLTDRLDEYLKNYNYGFKNTPSVKILTSKLGNDAGIVGAASLFYNEKDSN